ncbi:MAG: hypothetical protein HC910_03320 [Spirulinaceae cyanobacterium SM2_1_0]|nr:hypothetical protein [Spirulinaceae cyanobacterium SM2_1_0]
MCHFERPNCQRANFRLTRAAEQVIAPKVYSATRGWRSRRHLPYFPTAFPHRERELANCPKYTETILRLS